MTVSRVAKLSLVLGVASLLAVVAGHLALTDIHHGEGNLALEWVVVRICAGLIVAFQICALSLIWKVMHAGGAAAS